MATVKTSTTFIVTGPPRTKKNSSRIVRAGSRPVIIPSKAWTVWCTNALLLEPHRGNKLRAYKLTEPITAPVNCCATFYADRHGRNADAVGLYQGLADLLEKRGVVDDDKYIISWDGSRVLPPPPGIGPHTRVVLEYA